MSCSLFFIVPAFSSVFRDVKKNDLKQSEHGADRDKETCNKEIDVGKDSSRILISGTIKIRKENQICGREEDRK